MLVLFDLDGVIINSFDAWAAAYRKAVYPEKLTDEDIARDFLTPTSESLSRYGVKNKSEYFQSLNRSLKDNSHLVKVEADVEGALAELVRMGYTLGILTSRPKKIARIHCPPQLIQKFKVFIDREDAPPKPLPDGVFKACRDTGIPLTKTVFVGDQPVDAECAKNAGVSFLLYKPDNHVFRSHKTLDKIKSFSSFKELPKLISSMASGK